MADGALARFEADTAIAITGIAGPGGGTEEKPVGYVCWSVKLADGTTARRDARLPGDRAEMRDRSTTVAMHLLRRALRGRAAPSLDQRPRPRAHVRGARPEPADAPAVPRWTSPEGAAVAWAS